jgi:hypothetical protein
MNYGRLKDRRFFDCDCDCDCEVIEKNVCACKKGNPKNNFKVIVPLEALNSEKELCFATFYRL